MMGQTTGQVIVNEMQMNVCCHNMIGMQYAFAKEVLTDIKPVYTRCRSSEIHANCSYKIPAKLSRT